MYALLAALLGFPLGPLALAEDAPESDRDRVLYFLGINVGRSLRGDFDLRAEEFETVSRGIKDTIEGREEKLDPAEYVAKLQALSRERKAAMIEVEKVESAAFVKRAAAAEGAVTTESGLVITEIKAGTGNAPGTTDTVKVHYHGTLRDGTVFDSSVQRGKPAEFPLNRVIPCWAEGLQRVKVGGKSRLVCPPEIAYGDRGSPPTIPGAAALTFEVELLEIVAK